MNQFSALRTLARQNRDKAIARAQADYEQRLIVINKLERELTGNVSYRYQKLTACVEQCIPTDREFTIVDLMTALMALDDSRRWSRVGIHKHLATLRQKGLIRRLKKGRRGEPAVFVRTGVAVKERPFEDMSLSEVLAQVLADRRMNATELTVAVLESGYETKQNRRKLRMTIGNTLRRETDKFKRQGDKWLQTQ